MDRTVEFVEALRAAGYRITPQRLEICRALAESREHPTPQAIYRRIRAKVPSVSQATVYNTLTVLRDLGEVVEVGLGQDRTYYEPHPTPHANLICLRCGKIEDVDDPQVGALSERLASREGFSIKAAHMDIYGVCRACAATSGGHVAGDRTDSEEPE